jgi:hypothetical protein
MSGEITTLFEYSVRDEQRQGKHSSCFGLSPEPQKIVNQGYRHPLSTNGYLPWRQRRARNRACASRPRWVTLFPPRRATARLRLRICRNRPLGFTSMRPPIKMLHALEKAGVGETRSHGIKYRTMQGSHLEAKSPSATDALLKDAVIDKALNGVQKTGTGHLGNFYWLPNGVASPVAVW